ncbi:MAG TPA: lytic transglycosylase domain-containing protein, partial [Terriglobales bacterium]|nr:lytic transglycosylase domain-containing protein [Terriglobales bacterium]
FDFVAALDPRTMEQSEQRLAGLSTHDYVVHEVKRIAIELGQDEDVPQGFVDTVWAFVSACSESPAWFQGILDRSPRVQPILARMMGEAHLPEVFSYVAWIESRLDPHATSGAGARGLWQLMPEKARELGLAVDPAHGIDERTDPVRSTRAGTVFIGNLIRTFGREQFMCALAAYNLGDAGMRNAMRKIPDPMMPSSQKYWYLVREHLLPDETNGYVARIFSARIMAGAPARFGFRVPGAGT